VTGVKKRVRARLLGHHYAGKEVRAIAAFQADVWHALNGMETT
jgi:hypothetical protein